MAPLSTTRVAAPQKLSIRKPPAQFGGITTKTETTHNETVDCSVTTTTSSFGSGEWLFAVRDNGTGFKPKYTYQIFQALTHPCRKDVAGAGIGLAICKAGDRTPRRKIWAESETGRDSTFYFTVPAG